MARVASNSPLSSIRGRFGDLIIKHYGKRIVITRVPRFTKPRSASQKRNSDAFCRASDYAETVRADPELRRFYAQWARSRHSAVRPTAILDYLSTPKIALIDRSGYQGRPDERLAIVVKDRFKVVAVTVSLLDASGRVLETGDATPGKFGVWTYTTTRAVGPGVPVTVKATAKNRPGNRTVLRG